MSANTQHIQSPTLNRAIVSGILGGIAGGAIFGVMMAMMGMLPMVGMLVGQDSPVIGFALHMLISAAFGAVYGFVAPRLPTKTWLSVGIAGVAYGVLLWVVGALILMPLMLGMSAMVLQIGTTQINSLIGHLVFGVILAAVNKILIERE